MNEGQREERWLPLPGLRAARVTKLLSRPELAKLSGVALRTIVYLETSGSRARLSTLRRLATALDVEPAVLLRAPTEDPEGNERAAA